MPEFQPITGEPNDYDALVERARRARCVLLGEASHGTHEFYRERARITKRLIAEAGYRAVAVEADWPDAYRVNCHVRGSRDDTGASEALGDFRRFPVWMWRNTEVEAFVAWLHDHNARVRDGGVPAGFYGLDLYSMHRSMTEVVRVLEQVDPEAAARARERYACFDHVPGDPHAYAYQAGVGTARSCEDQAVDQLLELLDREDDARGAGVPALDVDRRFYAEQNARLVVNAEEYYRAMFRSGVLSWNLRDRHMGESLEALVRHLERDGGEPARVVVWAHNSHLGDARATEMGEAGELNLGQLARERYGREILCVGFTTYDGLVTAASDWGGAAEVKRVRPALEGSWEHELHQRGGTAFLVDAATLPGRRLERAIGVIYRPHTERRSHYFHARIADQFDAVIHIDRTRAVEPLEPESSWTPEPAETFPSGL